MLFLKTIYKKNCSFINYSASNLLLSVLNKNSDNLLQKETKSKLKLRRGLKSKIPTKRTWGDESRCTYSNPENVITMICFFRFYTIAIWVLHKYVSSISRLLPNFLNLYGCNLIWVVLQCIFVHFIIIDNISIIALILLRLFVFVLFCNDTHTLNLNWSFFIFQNVLQQINAFGWH